MPLDKRDHTKLLCDIGELSGLFEDALSLDGFLQRIVAMIAEHLHCPVCSIYLYYDESQELVLTATKGLNPDSIGRVRMKLGEGLTGLSLKEMRPICERQASRNPNFKAFPGIGEEQYESFLVAPIVRGQTRIGAIVVQNSQKNYFTEEDVKVFRAVTSQLANTIETTKLLMSLNEKAQAATPKPALKELKFVKGRPASEGFAFAEALVLGGEHLFAVANREKINDPCTLEDFRRAVAATEQELEQLQQQIEERLSDVASLIFSAQLLMLKDKSFMDAIENMIRAGVNPPLAILKAVEDYVRMFQKISDSYLREKSQDVRDIGRRLLENLLGKEEAQYDLEDKIIVAEELVPSDALKLSSQKVKGIILLSGGVTSHLSILAKSLSLPLVIADAPELLALKPRTMVLMDAEQGTIYIEPGADIVKNFHEREDLRARLEKLKKEMTPVTSTMDGTRVTLLANINLLGDLKAAREFHAEGVGLYRTEFPFLVRSDFPTEEEQYVIYRKLIEGIPGKEVTFRTLDIGGDKVLSYFHHTKEENPFLGMRSIRFSLKYKDIFAAQLRAILRAGHKADLKIMFPMISSLDEFLEARSVVKQCRDELQAEGIAHHANPAVGMMVELPAVLEIIDELAQEADFFSIGTNDFIQYMLAVDRTNEKVADLYLPHHPAVLRALKKIVEAADRHHREVSVCGGMGDDDRYTAYLLGIGIRRFSIDPKNLPRVQKTISSIDLSQARRLVADILKRCRLPDISKALGSDARDQTGLNPPYR